MTSVCLTYVCLIPKHPKNFHDLQAKKILNMNILMEVIFNTFCWFNKIQKVNNLKEKNNLVSEIPETKSTKLPSYAVSRKIRHVTLSQGDVQTFTWPPDPFFSFPKNQTTLNSPLATATPLIKVMLGMCILNNARPRIIVSNFITPFQITWSHILCSVCSFSKTKRRKACSLLEKTRVFEETCTLLSIGVAAKTQCRVADTWEIWPCNF